MTTPVNPTTVTVAAAPQPSTTTVPNDVAEAGLKVHKLRNLARTTANKVGLPVLIGSASALVTTTVLARRNRDNDSDVVIDDSSDYTNE